MCPLCLISGSLTAAMSVLLLWHASIGNMGRFKMLYSFSAACQGMLNSTGQLATEPILRRTGALPLSSIRRAYTSSLTLLRSTPTALEPTCNASGREMPG